MDPILLTQQLIQCPSVTPHEKGSLDLIQGHLESMGFICHRLTWGGDVDNLYARRGDTSPHLCFAGHVDVVPPGPKETWTHPPFAGTVDQGCVHGRGAVDMKGGIAAFMAATHAFVDTFPPRGSLSFLITSDEEGPAIHGTQKVMTWLQERHETVDHFLIGEPTGQKTVGDTLKIGRLGSLNLWLTCHGRQGHVAWGELADNPIPRMAKVLDMLKEGPREDPSHHFPPSTLQITTVDVGNPTVNVIPASISAHMNIRFNDQQTPESLETWVRKVCQDHGGPHELTFQLSGVADVCEDPGFIDLLQTSIHEETGTFAQLSTRGGTSDGRFLRKMAPVVELGLLCDTMHQINEHVPVHDLTLLTRIYHRFLMNYFSRKS